MSTGEGGWAVVDVETTGLNPARDRIAEIAVVRLQDDGQPIDEWATLVNPGGRAPARKSGLTKADLAGAPTFRVILDDLLARLAGRVVVAHNAPFDVAFLHAETVRAGIAWGPIEGFCTMEVLMQLGLSTRRDLHSCCASLGVATETEHVALHDARAVAGLMGYLGPRLWSLDRPAFAPYWAPARTPTSVVTRPAPPPPPVSLASPMSGFRIPPGLGVKESAGATYLGLLDLVVDDGIVTDNEIDALSIFAGACGITRPVARELHHAYLGEMTRLANEDGVVTDDERSRLVELTGLLGRALPR